MKSKIKTIILILVILALAGVYAVIDKPVSFYDTSCDTSKFLSIPLEEGKQISQNFQCKEEKLDGMAIKLSADNIQDKSQAVISYEVVDHESGDCVAQGEENLGKLRSGKFFKLKFDTVVNTKGKNYTFNLIVKNSAMGTVQVFYTPGADNTATLTYDGNAIDGVGVMRSLTHRFDLETYIVTLCFAAYIILFMRWLYKLFK